MTIAMTFEKIWRLTRLILTLSKVYEKVPEPGPITLVLVQISRFSLPFGRKMFTISVGK